MKREITERFEKFKEKSQQLFLWPLFGGVTTFFGVVAGYLGAHYDKEIANTFAPCCLFGNNLALGPTLFWAATVIFGGCFTGTFWAQARSSARISERMVGTTEDIDKKTDGLLQAASQLEERVRRLHTLPPVGFLETYRDIVIQSEEAYELSRSLPLDFPALTMAVRTQLLGILQLARAFDPDGTRAVYGVNLMLYYNSADLSKAELVDVSNRIVFIEKGVSVENLDGILDLVYEFSVSSLSDVDADTRLPRMALPIPKLSDEERKKRTMNGVLPGAPDAFTSRLEAVIETPDDWKDLANKDHFTSVLRNQLTEFFEHKSEWMQSFVSVPLFAPGSHNTETPIGIINIHRNLPNELAAEKFELLSPLLVPITLTLSRLIWLNRAVRPILSEAGS